MISHNKSINFYLLAICTGLSYLSLQSLAAAQTSSSKSISANNSELEETSTKIISTENISSSPILQPTSRAELIRKLKTRAVESQSRIDKLESPEDGKSKVTVLRFSQDWINRTPKRVLAARSQFSLGLGVLDATVNDSGVDGRFFSWVGQFQWVQNLGKDFIGVAKIATQLTPDSLLPLEQFSVGGLDTIRGYRQNQFVADNGITDSFEVRIPVVNNLSGWGSIQIAPFVDFGKVWSNSGEGIDNRIFASSGLGLRWQLNSFVARLDWGVPLTSFTRQGDSLQDNGLYFSVMYQPF